MYYEIATLQPQISPVPRLPFCNDQYISHYNLVLARFPYAPVFEPYTRDLFIKAISSYSDHDVVRFSVIYFSSLHLSTREFG